MQSQALKVSEKVCGLTVFRTGNSLKFSSVCLFFVIDRLDVLHDFCNTTKCVNTCPHSTF